MAFLLAACAGQQWSNPHKSAAEAAADEDVCNKQSEESALLHARRQRGEYNMPHPAGESGYYRGETSMQLADRGDTTKGFEKLLADCMSSKGYTLGAATPKEKP